MTPSNSHGHGRFKAVRGRLAPAALLAACIGVAGSASAQGGATDKGTPNDRARRDADKVFQMILMHGDKPRRARDDRPAAAPALAANSGAARSAASPKAAAASVAEGAPAAAAQGQTAFDVPSPMAPAVVLETTPPLREAPAPETFPVAAPTEAAAPISAAPKTAPRSTLLEIVAGREPDFPRNLVRRLGSGSVLVQFEVDTEGRVARTEVIRTSHDGLNAAAREAVATWRFKPVTEAVIGNIELKFD